jgi:hypothetical protein
MGYTRECSDGNLKVRNSINCGRTEMMKTYAERSYIEGQLDYPLVERSPHTLDQFSKYAA